MNQIDLRGRGAVVTGAARGTGYACAERLSTSGAKVSLWDMDATALAEAAHRLHALENPDEPLRPAFGDRRAGRLAVLGRMRLLDRRRVRHLGRPRDLLATAHFLA